MNQKRYFEPQIHSTYVNLKNIEIELKILV